MLLITSRNRIYENGERHWERRVRATLNNGSAISDLSSIILANLTVAEFVYRKYCSVAAVHQAKAPGITWWKKRKRMLYRLHCRKKDRRRERRLADYKIIWSHRFYVILPDIKQFWRVWRDSSCRKSFLWSWISVSSRFLATSRSSNTENMTARRNIRNKSRVKKEKLRGRTKRFRQQSENERVPRGITRTIDPRSRSDKSKIALTGIIGFLALFIHQGTCCSSNVRTAHLVTLVMLIDRPIPELPESTKDKASRRRSRARFIYLFVYLSRESEINHRRFAYIDTKSVLYVFYLIHAGGCLLINRTQSLPRER